MRRRARESLNTLDDEIRDHILRETEENIARGMAPDEAYTAARRAFGNVMLTKEAARTTWIPVWWDHFLQDTRYGLRLCVRAPGFTIVVVLTLALGIGLNTAVFSVVNAVLVRPLAYPNAERLVWVAPYNDRGQDDVVMSPDFLAWRDHATVFDRLVGFFTNAEPIDVGDEVVQARVAAVTDGFWDLTGASFALGGPPASGQEGVVLPHAFFERWFHADASVIGRPVTLNGQQTVITGVLPASFRAQLVPPPAFVAVGSGEIDVYRANVIRPPTGPGVQILNVMGLLKPGVSIERARAELESIRERQRSPDQRPGPGRSAHLRVVPYAEKLVGDARKPLIILQAAVALVLLIVCVNTANLLLVRGLARQREIAIRTAIGAGRARVLRQFVVENLLLSAIGCAAGLLVARGLDCNAAPVTAAGGAATVRDDHRRARTRVRARCVRGDDVRLRVGAGDCRVEDQCLRNVEGRGAVRIVESTERSREECARRDRSRAHRRLACCRRVDGEELLAHDRVSVRLRAGSRT